MLRPCRPAIVSIVMVSIVMVSTVMVSIVKVGTSLAAAAQVGQLG